MKLSQTGMGTVKLNNIDEMYPGQSILMQSGQLVQYGAGIFAYNNIPLLVFGIADPENIVRAVKGEKIGTLVS